MRAGNPPEAGRRQTAEAMELSELLVFLTVAGERSFSRAAAKLHRTQPAVSQAIRRLEEELGERLFDRSSKQGALTEAGRVLREYAQRLMRLSEEAEVAVRELTLEETKQNAEYEAKEYGQAYDPASITAPAATTTLEITGMGAIARPISSSTTANSCHVPPTPPTDSGNVSPSQPRSAARW